MKYSTNARADIQIASWALFWLNNENSWSGAAKSMVEQKAKLSENSFS
jgi:hypothetical protein